ncbi:MAG: DUF2252 family protein, partial [Planctomycetota bacterium]
AVLERYAGAKAFADGADIDQAAADSEPGRRVVQGQRMMQAASDMFLGWASSREGRHYYVRQLCDMKQSLPEEEWTNTRIGNIASLCGKVLARAHAKCTDVAELAGYLGDGARIDEAMAAFGLAYGDQVERDFEFFVASDSSGHLRKPADVAHEG